MATSDESVSEINLSGKQLVFLFMAVTVVSVVIFLMGVLVGRGVQQRQPTLVDAPAVPADEVAESSIETPVPSAAPADATKLPPLAYQKQLEASAPVAEKLAPATAPPPASKSASTPAAPAPAATAPAPATPPRAAPPAAKSASETVSPGLAEPRGDGVSIQVAALTGRAEAEAMASRLKAKGYAAYVAAALAGQPSGFRVRVGKFKTRAEAEQVAARLKREEQFNPWITR